MESLPSSDHTLVLPSSLITEVPFIRIPAGRRASVHHDHKRSCYSCAKGKRACDGNRPCLRCCQLQKETECRDIQHNELKNMYSSTSVSSNPRKKCTRTHHYTSSRTTKRKKSIKINKINIETNTLNQNTSAATELHTSSSNSSPLSLHHHIEYNLNNDFDDYYSTSNNDDNVSQPSSPSPYQKVSSYPLDEDNNNYDDDDDEYGSSSTSRTSSNISYKEIITPTVAANVSNISSLSLPISDNINNTKKRLRSSIGNDIDVKNQNSIVLSINDISVSITKPSLTNLIPLNTFSNPNHNTTLISTVFDDSVVDTSYSSLDGPGHTSLAINNSISTTSMHPILSSNHNIDNNAFHYNNYNNVEDWLLT